MSEWLVRYAREEDFTALLAMARADWQEFEPHHEWDEARCWETFHEDYLRDDVLTIFVVEARGQLCGFLIAGAYRYPAYRGLFTVQQLLYVKPEKRGSRAAALLIARLIEWSREIGAKEIKGGNENGVDNARIARFLGKFGFEAVGHSLRLRIE